MNRKVIYILISLLSFVTITKAQPINISNIVTEGRFNTCGVAPTIVANLVGGSGSFVQNGVLVCINPNDSSVIDVTISNIRWNINPDNNWLHGLYLTTGAGVRVIENSLMPPNWVFQNTCIGLCPTGGQTQGGAGYYFDGTTASSCCAGTNPNFFDGNPANNYGDSTAKCTKSYSVSFTIKVKNSFIRAAFTQRLRGSSDGNTGCWATADQVTTSTITYNLAGLACTSNPVMCNPNGAATFTTGLPGPYQWQHSSDSVLFTNISDNSNYAGTNTSSLSLTNMASNRYGEQFRCVANGINGQVFTLKFQNRWIGAINSDWNTPGNWSCGTVPDANTDVLINFGNIIISSNVTIRSLTLNSPATLTTSTGFALTILH
jgi:hypothetical protein